MVYFDISEVPPPPCCRKAELANMLGSSRAPYLIRYLAQLCLSPGVTPEKGEHWDLFVPGRVLGMVSDR